jgi:hypothetical protein
VSIAFEGHAPGGGGGRAAARSLLPCASLAASHTAVICDSGGLGEGGGMWLRNCLVGHGGVINLYSHAGSRALRLYVVV